MSVTKVVGNVGVLLQQPYCHGNLVIVVEQAQLLLSIVVRADQRKKLSALSGSVSENSGKIIVTGDGCTVRFDFGHRHQMIAGSRLQDEGITHNAERHTGLAYDESKLIEHIEEKLKALGAIEQPQVIGQAE